MSQSAFNLLAYPIQRILWDMRWRELRPIQREAIYEILQSGNDIIISARTAAGKTEAAFLPILSQIYENPQPSIQAIYVGPLKALINDQFRRLEDLCRRAEIVVHRWHGDVDTGKKRAMLKKPSGILLITPESIESLFVNHSTALTRVFQYLQFVVIDEIHAFVGNERGTHLRSLLFRLQQEINREYRIIALSATLGDAIEEYSNWLRPNQSHQTHHIHDPGEQKQIKYRIYGYISTDPKTNDACKIDSKDLDGNAKFSSDIVNEMHNAYYGKTSLIFANSRNHVELYADSLNEHCRQLGKPPEFLVHHGSLSKEIREYTENAMRSQRPHTTLCSSTLELGIDIGNVDEVGQIGPPWSVNSLVQRLGRSGRGEGQPQSMRVFIIENKLDKNSRFVDHLYPQLLCAIANTELMLQKWVEPPRSSTCDLSTLTQQILSVLAQTGGIKADRLYAKLVTDGAFPNIEPGMFGSILRSLAKKQLIEQMATGDIILAPNGERVVGHYGFYSAFATPIEYAVVFQSKLIGRLPSQFLPKERDHLILAARRWEVTKIDNNHREIIVVPAKGRKTPLFSGSIGDIHPKTRQMMRNVLFDETTYPYLNVTANRLLQQARKLAQRKSLFKSPIIVLGDDYCLWFTWTGSTIQRTLCLMAELAGLRVDDQNIAICFNAGPQKVSDCYKRFLTSPPTAQKLVEKINDKRMKKFDEYLSEALLVEALARDHIDIPGACRLIDTLP